MDTLAIVIVTVCGGLGVFLLGMRHLSNGLQTASGEGLRRFMSLATGNAMAGVATGVFSTIIVQSSSVIAVMLVGFVTARLMTLAQALNVLVGANIGTTFTVWLMAFAPSPEMLGLSLFTIGALAYFPLRRGRMRHVGLALIGLGLVFLGMFFMKEGVQPIRESPSLSAALGRLNATDLPSAALVALASLLVTAVIQSSAASILIFMTFAIEGLVTYETAIAALFGANVGTTATGWLAAIGGGSGAKRTALAHTLTNLVGSILLLPLAMPVIAPLGRYLFPSAFVPTAQGLLPGIMVPIACTDTLFAILRGLLTLPFSRLLARFLAAVIPEPPEEQPHLSALNFRVRQSPVIACAQAMQEVSFMSDSVLDLLSALRRVLSGEGGEDDERHIFRREDILDNVQREVTEFIGSIMLTRLSSSLADSARRILRLADDFESASDEAPAVVKALRRIRSDGGSLAGTDLALVLDIHDRAEALFRACAAPRETVSLSEIRDSSQDLKKRIFSARQVQLLRIGGDSSTASVLAVLDILNAYDRLRTASIGIASVTHRST